MKNLTKEFFRRVLDEDGDTSGRLVTTLKDTVSSSLSMASFYESPRLPRAITAMGLVVSVVNLGRTLYEFYKEHAGSDTYYVKIDEGETLFRIAEQWLMETMPEEEQLSFYARSLVGINESTGKREVIMTTFIDGSVQQEVTVGPHKVRIETATPEQPVHQKKRGDESSGRNIRFLCQSVQARQAVIEELSSRAESQIRRDPILYRSRNWGGFAGGGYVPIRPLESVILKEDQMEDLIGFLTTFNDSEEEYRRMGLPYHTGVLLHGNPGSGKTSTATAIANALGMNVYYISLSALDSDDTLYACMEDVSPRSIVILEDIDVANAMRERDDEESGVTMSGILNSLDGQMAPHGAVFIMTTNHVDELDDAVIRPGRVDLMIELNEMDNYQLAKTCEYFMGMVPEGLPHITPEDGITSAHIISLFKKYMPHYENASEELIEFLNSALVDGAPPLDDEDDYEEEEEVVEKKSEKKKDKKKKDKSSGSNVIAIKPLEDTPGPRVSPSSIPAPTAPWAVNQ